MWGLDLGHLNQSDAQGPDVGFVVIWGVLHGLTHHHLGGHPEPTKGQQRAQILASTGASQRLRVKDQHKPTSGGWQHSRVMIFIPFHPTVFLRTVFSHKDAFRAAPMPKSCCSSDSYHEMAATIQNTGSWGRGGWEQWGRGPGKTGGGKEGEENTTAQREGMGEKRRKRNKGAERERKSE